MAKTTSKLDPKKRYLQIALNNDLAETRKIIANLPLSDRIILEAGTPLIKRYGIGIISEIKHLYSLRLSGSSPDIYSNVTFKEFISFFAGMNKKTLNKTQNLAASFNTKNTDKFLPYVVADFKMMDRGETEAELAAEAGADAAVALGHAPVESLNAFIQKCNELGIDAMIDMMNVEYPLHILRQLKKQPQVVILHRGVDEERFNREKILPLYEIRRIKANYDILIAVAGGDSIKEVQSAVFNDADIVVVWKDFYQSSDKTLSLAEEFLQKIK